VPARLDLGKLELFAQDLGQLGQGQIDLELMLAALVSGLALAGLVRVALPDRVPGLAFALADTALLLLAEPEMGNVDLRQRDGDHLLALAADHLAVGDVLLQILLDLAFNDLSKPVVISLDIVDQRFLLSLRSGSLKGSGGPDPSDSGPRSRKLITAAS